MKKIADTHIRTVNTFHLQTIEIAVVCAGQRAASRTVILLKSILYNRHNPLSFHFVVNDISKKILAKLFETWKLPFGNHITVFACSSFIRLVILNFDL